LEAKSCCVFASFQSCAQSEQVKRAAECNSSDISNAAETESWFEYEVLITDVSHLLTNHEIQQETDV